jgi:hypothetical protein
MKATLPHGFNAVQQHKRAVFVVASSQVRHGNFFANPENEKLNQTGRPNF